MDFAGFAATLVAVYAYALAVGALLLRRSNSVWTARIVGILLLFFPLIIAPTSPLLRALAEVLCLDAFLKIVDFARHCQASGHERTLREYVYLLIPFPIFLAVLEQKTWLPNRNLSLPNFARICVGAIGVAGGFAIVFGLNQWPPIRSSFLFEHCIKVAVFILTVESGSTLIHGLERLVGFNTTPLVKNVFFSVTVAEFWLRWNNRVHQWLKANLFRPAARKLGRIGGVVAVFAFSGLFHEIAFDVATSRIDGYQLAFFVLQTPMVLLSEYFSSAIRRQSFLMRAISYLVTVAWMTVTSMLFLRGVDRIFPFLYVNEPWLP